NRLRGVAVKGSGSWVVANKARENRADGFDIARSANVLLYNNKGTSNAGHGLEADVSGLVALCNAFTNNKQCGFSVAAGKAAGEAVGEVAGEVAGKAAEEAVGRAAGHALGDGAGALGAELRHAL